MNSCLFKHRKCIYRKVLRKALNSSLFFYVPGSSWSSDWCDKILKIPLGQRNTYLKFNLNTNLIKMHLFGITLAILYSFWNFRHHELLRVSDRFPLFQQGSWVPFHYQFFHQNPNSTPKLFCSFPNSNIMITINFLHMPWQLCCHGMCKNL